MIYSTFSVYIVIYKSTASPHCVSLQRWLEFIALFTTLLSQAGVLKMGNSASIPLPCWERVLSYLPLPDVQSLMKSNSDVCELIHQNRYFWHERAQQFYRLDPSAFSVLSNSETDILYGLVQRVCRAWIHLEATEGNVATDVHSTMDYDMKGDVLLISVDQLYGRIAVHFEEGETRIFDIENMGQGPIRTVRVQPLREMILHGPVIFMRESPRREEFHTEVHNWRLDIGMAALRPGYMRICGAPLKKSYDFLLAYDMHCHAALAYPLTKEGYKVEPLSIKFPSGTVLHDHDIIKSRIYTVLAQDGAAYFMEFSLPNGELVKRYLIACPIEFHEPRIAYPYVLITQRPFNGDLARQNSGIYGARIRIPGNINRVTSDRFVVADELLDTPTTSDYYIFLKDIANNNVKIVVVGDPSAPFHVVDTVPLTDNCVIAAWGLSIIYVRDTRLVIRRYAPGVFR